MFGVKLFSLLFTQRQVLRRAIFLPLELVVLELEEEGEMEEEDEMEELEEEEEAGKRVNDRGRGRNSAEE